MRYVAGLAAVVALVVMILGGFASDLVQPGPSIARYCSYGAVSEAQFERCQEHVTESDVERSDTNAGRYGRAEIGSCGADAGPLCGITDRPEPDDGWGRAGP